MAKEGEKRGKTLKSLFSFILCECGICIYVHAVYTHVHMAVCACIHMHMGTRDWSLSISSLIYLNSSMSFGAVSLTEPSVHRFI